MSHAVVQLYNIQHFIPQPPPSSPSSPLHKCQRHQICRSYNITIPNVLNTSASVSPRSVDNSGYSSPNPELITSFASIDIDGDYDDEETPNVELGLGVGVGVAIIGLGVATAPPLDDDEYVVTCENKPNATPQTQIQIQEEEEMCIICYDKIEQNHGNFYSNFCDTCKYTVHISCIEKYIIQKLKDDVQIHQTRFVGIKCLLCSKVVESSELTQEEFDEINNSGSGMSRGNRMTAEQRRDMQLHEHALRVMERQIRRDRMHNNKRFVCHVCFILCLIICAGGVLAAIVTKKT